MSGDPQRHERLAEIYGVVFRLGPDERRRVLDAECADDPGLRAEVERLLAASNRDDILADEAVEAGSQFTPLVSGDALASGPEIRGYRVLGLLGEGGMGAVYEAEQERPHRRVALKVIRSGLVTRSLLARFRREAEVLGRLNHPGIAQIYEVGVGEAGGRQLPYLAMELVEGVSVTAYAEANKLGTRDRLELACRICEAVEHAHQRGVIHRDLKPANILVDASGRPKILDFGVARLTDSDVLVTTLQTEAGQIVGTAGYMSPEQATGNPDDLDTRSDIYSLGVVIFELLAGRLPISVERLPLPDAIRAIRETEATRIGSVNTALRGDVDTILAKALERDKARRYQSASELGGDIRRFLDDQPIVARPPSTFYQLVKFTRRNRVLVASTAAVILALAVGLVAATVSLSRERQAKADMQAALTSESKARGQAEESLERARGSSKFLEHILLGLGPDEAKGRDTALLEAMLMQAESSLDDEVANPAVRADMLTIMGRTHHAIFEYEQAARLLDKAHDLYDTLEPDDPAASTEATLVRADAHRQLGENDIAEKLLDEAIETYRASGDSVLQSQAARQLAELKMDAGQWDRALELIEDSLTLTTDVPDIDLGRIEMMHGAILRRLRRLEEARAAYDHSLSLFRGVDAKIESGIVLNSLAVLARDEGRLEDAEKLYRESIDLRRSVDPRPNPNVAVGLSNLGRLLLTLDRVDEAKETLEQSLQMHIDLYGKDHYTVAFPSMSLGEVYGRLGDHDRAVDLADRGVKLLETQFGTDNPTCMAAMTRSAQALEAAGRHAESEAAFRRCLELLAAASYDPAPHMLPVQRGLGEALLNQGRKDEARAAFEAALQAAGAQEDAASELQALIERCGNTN
ncbi:MAG: tetratricopeptide repeat protein [Phycisphaeraceae bacterium]|nr:MAG: tetratricopeptide repeat protein [Phycisphaeraceae bacterium]